MRIWIMKLAIMTYIVAQTEACTLDDEDCITEGSASPIDDDNDFSGSGSGVGADEPDGDSSGFVSGAGSDEDFSGSGGGDKESDCIDGDSECDNDPQPTKSTHKQTGFRCVGDDEDCTLRTAVTVSKCSPGDANCIIRETSGEDFSSKDFSGSGSGDEELGGLEGDKRAPNCIGDDEDCNPSVYYSGSGDEHSK